MSEELFRAFWPGLKLATLLDTGQRLLKPYLTLREELRLSIEPVVTRARDV